MPKFLISIIDSFVTYLNELSRNQDILMFIDTPASRKFKWLNLYPAAKGPPAVIKNIRTSLVRARLPHKLIFRSELDFNLKCDLKKSKAKVVLIPSWSNDGDDLEELLCSVPKTSLILIGPNISLSMDIINKICKKYEGRLHFLMPSKQIFDYFSRVFKDNKALIRSSSILPTPIDHESWKPSKFSHKTLILIYLKNYKAGIDDAAIAYLKHRFLNRVRFVKYGEYTSAQFRSVLKRTYFAVYLADTESQGLALLEMWSSNVTTFIRLPEFKTNADTSIPWKYGEREEEYAPFLSSQNGAFFSNVKTLENLIDDLETQKKTYTPRDWVLSNLNFESFCIDLKKIIDD